MVRHVSFVTPSEGTMENDGRFRRPFRTDFVWGRAPGTLCRANFQSSRRDLTLKHFATGSIPLQQE